MHCIRGAFVKKLEADRVSFRRINRVSNATVPSKWLHSINQQASIYKSVSGFSCFPIGYLFIDA